MAEQAVKDREKGVVALDIAGPEEGWIIDEEYIKACKIAKEGGLKITIHAGEASGPETVIDAITKLGADRIGHGVRIIYSEDAVKIVKERNIPLELCLTSNVQTNAVPSIEEHPIKKLYDKGINVTLNTDDPAISDITMSSELQLAMDTFNFTIDEIKEIILNGLNASFLTEKEKKIVGEKYFNRVV